MSNPYEDSNQYRDQQISQEAQDIIQKQFLDEFSLMWYQWYIEAQAEALEQELNTEKGPVEPE